MAVNTIFVIASLSVVVAFLGVWYMTRLRQRREQQRLDHLQHRQEELDALLKKVKEEKPGSASSSDQ